MLFFDSNYTGHASNQLLGIERFTAKRALGGGDMSTVAKMKSKNDSEKSQLSRRDLRLLLVMCTEMVSLCAKLTGRIDPAAAAMLAYVRDDIVHENKSELQ